MFIIFVLVCSLKSMCIPSFVLIGNCVHAHVYNYVPIVMYGLRLFIVVLQELHCQINMPILSGLRISISSHVSSLNSVLFLRYVS